MFSEKTMMGIMTSTSEINTNFNILFNCLDASCLLLAINLEKWGNNTLDNAKTAMAVKKAGIFKA